MYGAVRGRELITPSYSIARDVIVMLDFVIVQLYERYATTGL